MRQRSHHLPGVSVISPTASVLSAKEEGEKEEEEEEQGEEIEEEVVRRRKQLECNELLAFRQEALCQTEQVDAYVRHTGNHAHRMHVSQRYTHTLGSVRVHVVYTRTNVELAHKLAEIKYQPSIMKPLMRALSRRHSKVWSQLLAFLHINDAITDT